jgi:hypothetical protein
MRSAAHAQTVNPQLANRQWTRVDRALVDAAPWLMVATDPVPTLTRVDAHLKLLAEVSLAVERAEAAAGEGGFTGAREALDEAEAGLQVLRERWPEMGSAERALVGRAAAPVKQRLDAVARRLPRPSALTQAAPEHDPEEEQDPAAA